MIRTIQFLVSKFIDILLILLHMIISHFIEFLFLIKLIYLDSDEEDAEGQVGPEGDAHQHRGQSGRQAADDLVVAVNHVPIRL